MLLALAALTGCGQDPAPTPSAPRWHVASASVQRTVVPRDYAVPGSVIADDRVQISSRISGFIKTLAVREGDSVRTGQVLVEIDPADVVGAISRAQAALRSAEADLADARVDVGKFTALAASGGIPRDTLRKAEVRRDVAGARAAEARAALHLAQAQRAYTSMVSPVDGVVVARLRQAGDLATPGVPILELESRASLVFQTFVAESRVAALDERTAVEVRLDAVPQPLTGRVLRVVPSGDVVTRRYEVKLSLPPTPGLLPGMFGRARFVVGQDEVLTVPRAAVVERGGLTGAFRVEPDGAARFRWLRLRREFDQAVEVTAGLAEGDRVVLSPPAQLRDADRIEPLPPEP